MTGPKRHDLTELVQKADSGELATALAEADLRELLSVAISLRSIEDLPAEKAEKVEGLIEAEGNRRGLNGSRIVEYTRLMVRAYMRFGNADGHAAKAQALEYWTEYFSGSEVPSPTDDPFLDLRRRINHMALCYEHADETRKAMFMRDIEQFRDEASRGAFTKPQIRETVEDIQVALAGMKLAERETSREIARLNSLLKHRDPVQLVALEQQWLCYRTEVAIQDRMGDPVVGASQRATIDALRTASAYCWAPMCVEAVAAAAASLPGDTKLTPEVLGELAPFGTSGWWWFEEPIPVQTVSSPAAERPVVALLWRREHWPARQLDETSNTRIWFSTLIQEQMLFRGRMTTMPVPTTAWMWNDGLSLDALAPLLRAGYHDVYAKNRGTDNAGVEITVQASEWFSRFFIAACAWLKQRILVREHGQGIRQVARSLERDCKLDHTPTVEIIHLRRRESAQRTEPSGEPSNREFHCRWIVHGHWRQQYYASTGRHAPKWIESYVKGPDDKPLKQAARVYAVDR